MAKGYWLARLTVTDPSAYCEYRKLNEAIYAKFGAAFHRAWRQGRGCHRAQAPAQCRH